MVILSTYEQTLLDGWEDVFKKGQLTMWIMLALKDGAKHMAEIKGFIHESTSGTLVADDQSMYRALRRYKDAEMVDFNPQAGVGGPDRKIYGLTATGHKVLQTFLERNITDVLFKPEVKHLIERR